MIAAQPQSETALFRKPGMLFVGTLVVLTTALAFTVNLATSTISVPDGWVWALWAVLALLMAASVAGEAARQRDQRQADSAAPTKIIGRIPPEAAYYLPRHRENRSLRRALGRLGGTPVVALIGARGVGKTQMAAAYARDCVRRGHSLVAWVDAESGPEFGLARLARECGLGREHDPPGDLVLRLRSHLETAAGRCLVVLDNLEDPDAVWDFLPVCGRSKVVITSNRQEFAGMSGVAVVPVGMFTSSQGKAFLRAATALPSGMDAERVGGQLGWLPLGLVQAAAYIRQNHVSYQDYLSALAADDLDETLGRRPGADHPGVLRAVRLTIDALVDADSSGDAIMALVVLAFLSSEGISRELLHRGAAGLALSGSLDRAIELLSARSLVDLSGDLPGGRIGVHRLTARVIRFHVTQHGAAVPFDVAIDAAARLLATLATTLPDSQVANRRASVDEIVGHVRSLRRHVCEPPVLLLVATGWAGQALVAAGDLRRAVPILEDLVRDSGRLLGDMHEDTLAARHRLAYAYYSAGRLLEAELLGKLVLTDRRSVLGHKHPDTLFSQHTLALVYRNQGRLAEAVSLYEQILRDFRHILGDKHPETLKCRHNLAAAHRSTGALEVAIGLYEAVLRDRIEVLGASHPDTLRSRHDMAYACYRDGQADRAIGMFVQVLADRRRILGEDHPDTLETRHNLAGAHLSAGRKMLAIQMYGEVLTDRVRVLGEHHQRTIGTRHNLAAAYAAVGRSEAAVTLYGQVLVDRRRVLGVDHPDTLTCRHNQACVLLERSHPAAVELLEQVHADRCRILGLNHPDTVETGRIIQASRVT